MDEEGQAEGAQRRPYPVRPLRRTLTRARHWALSLPAACVDGRADLRGLSTSSERAGVPERSSDRVIPVEHVRLECHQPVVERGEAERNGARPDGRWNAASDRRGIDALPELRRADRSRRDSRHRRVHARSLDAVRGAPGPARPGRRSHRRRCNDGRVHQPADGYQSSGHPGREPAARDRADRGRGRRCWDAAGPAEGG
jgi:hypothetical protein